MTEQKRLATEYQRIRASESRIEFALAGIMTLLIAGTMVYIHILFEPIAPRFNLMLWTGFMGFVTVVMTIVPLTIFIRRPDDVEIATVWANVGKVVALLFDLAVASAVWLLLPYANEQLQLLMVIFFCATISGQVISTAESIDNISFGVVAIFGSTAVFFLQSDSIYAIPVAVFLVAFGVLMIGVALVLKFAVRSAIKSKMKAEDISAELGVALEKAQHAYDERTSFIAAASHDLRQPIQAAMLFFQQLLLQPKESVRIRAEQGMRNAFQEANALLDRMLEHLRLESGTMQASLAAVELAPLIKKLVAEHEVLSRKAGVRLKAFPGKHWVTADPHLLTRILRNLVHNALTHARGTRVCLFTRRIGDRLHLFIIDDGVGLNDTTTSYFEPYVQGAFARGAGQGMGLGLTISRAMARLMNCNLDVDARWQQGAALYIDLPLYTGSRPATPSLVVPGVGREALAPLRIVVVDDDEGARVALANLLAMIARDVRAVGSLAELEQLEGFTADLVVSDWHLDNANRGDAAVAIAQKKWPSCAAVLITGDGSIETLQAMSASSVPMLWKPTDIDALGATASQALAAKAGQIA